MSPSPIPPSGDGPFFPSPERLVGLREATRSLVAEPLPLPGAGGTARRWRALHRWARIGPVSVARLAEGHLDATAILAEARAAGAGAGARDDPASPSSRLYGVWASSGPPDDVRYTPASGTITGVKRFCSGLGIVERALVTAIGPEGEWWLVDVDLGTGQSLRAEPGPWHTPALADTATGSVRVERHPVKPVAGPGWYLARPGFWHGAIGPAACWAGAAAGLADRAGELAGDDPFQRAALGELRAWDLACRTLLDAAGDATDAAPADGARARYRALATRHAIERAATAMADRFSQAFGPRPFVADAGTAQRIADLHLYLRQHHGDRELAQLALLAAAPEPGPR